MLGRVSSSCSTSDTRLINIVTNPVISHERGQDWELLTTSGTYPWSFVTQIFHNGQPGRGADRKTFESDDFNLTKRNPWFSSILVSSNSLSRKPDRNHNLWNIVSTERYILHMQVLLECCYI